MDKSDISICRVYSPPHHKEGVWVLVDRLWPRGLKKESIPFDLWLKDIAPSPSLRQWFHQDSANHWLEFAQRYLAELQDKAELIKELRETARRTPVTLFYAAKDTLHNHALVLQKTLLSWPDAPELI